jgi:hypothetical protein
MKKKSESSFIKNFLKDLIGHGIYVIVYLPPGPIAIPDITALGGSRS